jgi:PAS domain-containing protein
MVGTRRERIAVGATAALWLGLVAWSGYLVLFANAPHFDALYVLGALLLCALAALAVMMYHGRQQALDYRMKGLRFRTLVQTAQDLIWAVDADGRWAYVNDAVRRIYGYEPEELLGRHYKDILAPGEEKKLREVIEQTESGVPLHPPRSCGTRRAACSARWAPPPTSRTCTRCRRRCSSTSGCVRSRRSAAASPTTSTTCSR